MAVDYFLKIDGIEGESQDIKHKGEIDILSWSWGESNSGSSAFGGGAGAGKVSMQDFHFVMKINKASPKLFQATATGQSVKQAVLSGRRSKHQQEFLKWTLSNLLVSSYQTAGGGEQAGGLPIEQFSLNFARIRIDYRPQKPDGTLGEPVTAEFDLAAQKT